MTPAAGLPPAQDVIEAALATAGEGCAVLVEDSAEAEVRFANNTTTTNGVRIDRRVTVICFADADGGTAAGVASRGGIPDVSDLVHAAQADARGSAPADDAESLVHADADAAFGEGPGHTDLGVFANLLGDLKGTFARAEDGDRVLYGFAEHRVATTYLGTSTGLRRRHLQPTGALHLVARSTDGTRSAWAGAGTADFTDVSLEVLEAEVTRRLGWADDRVELPAGRYEVILPPAAVADLMVPLLEAAGLREAEEGRTVFAAAGGGTRLGERLCEAPLSLWSDPAAPGLECAPFLATGASSSDVSVFDNGLGLERTDWISDGTLRRLRTHRAGAARAKIAPTPPIDNLALEMNGATGTVEDLVAHTERGLLLTCLWYIREVDPATLLLTGLTRDGVYVVEDGRVVGATTNFRFNESPVSLLEKVQEAGAPTRTLGREFGEWLNRTAMPPVRVAGFNMSSVSPAS